MKLPTLAKVQTAASAIALMLHFAGYGNAQGESPAANVLGEPEITPADRQHWAFAPLVRPDPPGVKNVAWVRNDIDRFILVRLEQANLAPMPAADPATLLRRITFDLTGLPPTPHEIDEFLADWTPAAYEKLIDRLLSSAAYGERYAQHWLDLARYAETDGFEHDLVRPLAWKYRDWVIEAFNRDLPYDEFVRLQLAGDELYPADESAAVATGFVLCGPDMPDLNLQEERRHNVLNELTSSVGATLLGLQIGCAQCHNHKFDPLSQADFYRLRAVFEPAVSFKDHSFGRVLYESGSKPPVTHLALRGDFRKPGPALHPAFPRIANPWNEAVPAPAEAAATTGRRTALAHWLTRPDHPLATRVIANRLWQYHFGQGLVGTSSDFGLMGESPSHPALLDWLATELPRQGWSLKRMHKLILASATYQQASRPGGHGWTAQQTRSAEALWQQAQETDPHNQLLSRRARQRLDGEAIRDAMLASARKLSSRKGGPGVRPPLPDELVATLLKKQWEVSPEEEDHRRRSVYLFVRRNLRYPIFEAFDKPDTNASCPRRNRSTTSPQALLQFNSEFSWQMARELAADINRVAGHDPAASISHCYLRCLGRAPTAAELKTGCQFLSNEDHGQPNDRFALLCLAVFNLNEFLYVD